MCVGIADGLFCSLISLGSSSKLKLNIRNNKIYLCTVMRMAMPNVCKLMPQWLYSMVCHTHTQINCARSSVVDVLRIKKFGATEIYIFLLRTTIFLTEATHIHIIHGACSGAVYSRYMCLIELCTRSEFWQLIMIRKRKSKATLIYTL